MRIGRPIVLAPMIGPASKQVMEEVTTEIMGRVAALIPERYHGHYAAQAGRDWKYTVEIGAVKTSSPVAVQPASPVGPDNGRSNRVAAGKVQSPAGEKEG